MDKRASIISVITNPLGFFALSLLIIEGYLTIVVVTPNNLPIWSKISAMFIAPFAFFVIIGVVTAFVWKNPLNLTLGGRDWNEFYGNSNNPKPKSAIDRLPNSQVGIIANTNASAQPDSTKKGKKKAK